MNIVEGYSCTSKIHKLSWQNEIWNMEKKYCTAMFDDETTTQSAVPNYNYWTTYRVDGSILGQSCRPGTRNSETQKERNAAKPRESKNCGRNSCVDNGHVWTELSVFGISVVWYCGCWVLSRWTLLFYVCHKNSYPLKCSLYYLDCEVPGTVVPGKVGRLSTD